MVINKFQTPGGCSELFIALESTGRETFKDEVTSALCELQTAIPSKFKLIWARFHVSDIANQYADIYSATREISAMISITGQAPLSGAHIAVEAYAIEADCTVECNDNSVCKIDFANYSQMFFNQEKLSSSGSYDQMYEEFNYAEELLKQYSGTLENNLQRTWIYCRDIDNNYAGLVKARRELFNDRGMVPDTHYISSTGIEGQSYPHDRLVRMDNFALFGHKREQISYLHALENLSPTYVYGVTFERATRIVYGDRSHYYISGTASIDKEGNVMYLCDVEKQTERLLDNVEALLAEGGGKLSDLRQAVVYLRDPADRAAVEKVMSRRLSADTARIMVRGAVCRPTWLVEMDGIAVNSNGDKQFGALV
ncbi:MAG: hypothetical protein E7045_09070 [Lentisphaerae bacterium]|nr:hypothetical protein [Lentisphaerota bacterium]